MSSKKEVLVVGFGAVGVIYSFIIKHGGKAIVTCVARGNYAATQADGIHIKSRMYGDFPGWKPDRLFNTVEAAADRPYSYVIVTTKALPRIAPASTLLAPLLDTHPLPTFVFLQNGLSVERDLYDIIDNLGRSKPSIISTALWIGTNILEGNVVEHSNPERMSIGIYRPTDSPNIVNTFEETTTLQEFAALVNASGSPLEILNDVQPTKFQKIFWNAGLGTCSALVRYPFPAFYSDPAVESHVIPQIRAMMLEILAIGRAIGFDEQALPACVVDDAIESTGKLHKTPHSTHKTSTLLDIENGRPMEIEVILGELVRKAKELHVDAPRLELMYSLLSVVQNQIVNGIY